MEYRRITTRGTWHFCQNCSCWPTIGYRARLTPPAIVELCNECLKKKLHDKCEQTVGIPSKRRVFAKDNTR